MPASPVRLVVPTSPPSAADEDPKLLTLPQVCRRVGVGPTKIYDLIRKGRFPRPVKIGNMSRWPTRKVDAWVEAQIAASEA